MTEVKNHAGSIGTYTPSGVMNYPGYQILGMHLRKFPDNTEFPSWKVNYRTEVCSETQDPCLAMQWIKEIEKAKSINDFITPRLIMG